MNAPAPGTVIDARYRVERMLGRGGMGVVVEARHLQLDTLVALKFLRRPTKGALVRFLREARASAALTSEHVCRVFDVGLYEAIPYIVMEWLDGTDLRAVLRMRGRLPVQEACEYVSQACAGLVEAHALQIVHRDLKPSNLFLTRRSDGSPLIKLLDFGVAKVPQPAQAELTATNVALGSPGYMSPEQMRASKTADHRSDLWSLGVILFELVAGHRPFPSNGAAELGAEPTPTLPQGPAALDPIIACCLARAPEYRYRDAGELAGVLAAFCEDRTVGRRRPSCPSSAAPPPPAPSDDPPDPATTLSAGVIELPPRRRPARITMSALLALCAGCAVVGLSMRHRGDPGLASSPAAMLGDSRDAVLLPAPPDAAGALQPSDPAAAPAVPGASDPPAALEAPAMPAALESPDRALAEDPAPHGPPPAVRPVPSRRTPAPGSRRPAKPGPPPERIPGVVELSEHRL